MKTILLAAFLIVSGATCAAAGQRPDDRAPSETIESGRDTYIFHCAACHGRSGKGDGPVVSALKAAPPDLTTLAKRSGGRIRRAEITAFIAGIGRKSPAHGSSDMPVWGPLFRELNPSETRIDVRLLRLVDYLESIQVK